MVWLAGLAAAANKIISGFPGILGGVNVFAAEPAAFGRNDYFSNPVRRRPTFGTKIC